MIAQRAFRGGGGRGVVEGNSCEKGNDQHESQACYGDSVFITAQFFIPHGHEGDLEDALLDVLCSVMVHGDWFVRFFLSFFRSRASFDSMAFWVVFPLRGRAKINYLT